MHGEDPSLYEPLSEAPCLRRTAFNRFNVDMLKPCLNDCKVTIEQSFIRNRKTMGKRSTLTDIDGPRISRKSILRNRSHSTNSSTDGYRLSGDSNIICSTSTTCMSIGINYLIAKMFMHTVRWQISPASEADYTGWAIGSYNQPPNVSFCLSPINVSSKLFEQIILIHITIIAWLTCGYRSKSNCKWPAVGRGDGNS